MIPLESNTGCGMEMTRRAFLGRTSGGLGLAALTGLLQSKTTVNAAEGLNAGITDGPHFVGRAKRVIFLCMAGGPSHLESFDSFCRKKLFKYEVNSGSFLKMS